MPIKTNQNNYELQTLSVENLDPKAFKHPNNGQEMESQLYKHKSLDRLSTKQNKDSYTFEENGHKSMIDIQSPETNGNHSYSQFKKHWNIKNPQGFFRYDSVVSSGYGSVVDLHASMDDFPSSHANTPLPLPEEDYDMVGQWDINDGITDSGSFFTNQWPLSMDNLSSLEIRSASSTSFVTPVITPPPESEEPKKRNEYIRLVERFGNDKKDTCLFPLALPMDGSDVYKGASTYESISLLADCILYKWEENSKKNRKAINHILPNVSRHLCPNHKLEGSKMEHPNALLPMRKCNSELDLTKLGFNERKGLYSPGKNRNRNNVSAKNRVKSRDDININVGVEKTSRKRLSLKQKSSVEQSKDISIKTNNRFNEFDNQRLRQKMNFNSKSLINSIKIENPISIALQITQIEKNLLRHLPSDEIIEIVLNRSKRLRSRDNCSSLRNIIEFGEGLSSFVSGIICRETTDEMRGKKIAAVIEVACVLRKLRNWQSLVNWVRGIQSPRVYAMASAWSVTKNKYPVHFNDYLKLTQIARNNSLSILRSKYPCIPPINAIISLLRVRCVATWDRMEYPPRWLESPNLMAWLEKQVLNNAIQNGNIKNLNNLKNLKKNIKNEKNRTEVVANRRNNSFVEVCVEELSLENRSFLPYNDPIYFITDDQFPFTWIGRSARNIPSQYDGKMIRCLHNSFLIELLNLDKFKFSS